MIVGDPIAGKLNPFNYLPQSDWNTQQWRGCTKTSAGEIKPSIDRGAKIADALNVTLDFLVKDAEYQNIDNDALKRLKLLEKLSVEDKKNIYALMDAFLTKSKLQTLME